MKSVFRVLVISGAIFILASVVGGVAFGLYSYNRLTRDLPKIQAINDYQPKAVSTLFSDDGELIAEMYKQRRYPVLLDEIPLRVRNAFLAAEDANFYSHPGIDLVSIFRAVWVNLTSGQSRQGGSTITQQIVKSLLLTREKTYERKAKEAILSYRLEKALTKDEILTMYLNEIFLGSGAYGIKAAAQVHFRKSLDELTTAEAAYLAGLPQRPSYLAKLSHRKQALQRQRYVLQQMLRNNFITKEEFEIARDSSIEIFPAENSSIKAAPYFASYAMHEVDKIFESLDMPGAATEPGGYVIETAVSLKAYELAEKSVRDNLKDIDKRQGWRGVVPKKIQDMKWFSSRFEAVRGVEDLVPDEIYPAKVVKVTKRKGIAVVQVGELQGIVDLSSVKWARRYLDGKGRVTNVKPLNVIETGDWIEVSLAEKGKDKKIVRFELNQTPAAQSAMTVLNALTGEVKAIIGGYDYQISQFNRATQGLLQPGSSFKPFIYLAAIEELGYTPASIVPDSPVRFPAGDGTIWSPQNYDHRFLGPITLRSALQMSRNVVSVHLLDRIGVRRGIESARRLGITTPIAPNMSISLGTPEIRQIELVRAYGAFAAEGYLADSIVIRSIRDRNGKEIYVKHPKLEKVIDDPADAFLMANMMKGVVERGTAQRVKALGRPIAGKTGTTNDQKDAWFVGYTPEWVAGVWVGFDVKKTLGRYETGGKAAAPSFISFMQEWLKDTPIDDFSIPDGVIPVKIHLQSGRLAPADSEEAFTEYFKAGTEPRYTGRDISIPRDYLSNDEF